MAGGGCLGRGGGHFLFEGSYPCMVGIGHTVYRFLVSTAKQTSVVVAVINAVEDRKKEGWGLSLPQKLSERGM